MITIYGKLAKEKVGKGTITHEDRETLGINFKVLYSGKTHVWGSVTGEPENIQIWSDRVGTEPCTKEDIIAAHAFEMPATVTCVFGFEHPQPPLVIEE